MPGLTKCNIAEMVSILNFLYSTKLLKLFKFKIRRKPPSDFLPTNMGEINSLGSCFVSTITNLALISAATNSCSFFAKWILVQFHCWKVVSYFSMHSRYCSQDLSVRCKFLPLFQAERKVPPWNDLTLYGRYFLMWSKFFICNSFWKEISVSLVSSWSFRGRCPFCTAVLLRIVVVVFVVVVLRLV